MSAPGASLHDPLGIPADAQTAEVDRAYEQRCRVLLEAELGVWRRGLQLRTLDAAYRRYLACR